MQFAAEKAPDYAPLDDETHTFGGALSRDPIAMVRSLVRGVSVNSQFLL
jgi:hypothetical protein